MPLSDSVCIYHSLHINMLISFQFVQVYVVASQSSIVKYFKIGHILISFQHTTIWTFQNLEIVDLKADDLVLSKANHRRSSHCFLANVVSKADSSVAGNTTQRRTIWCLLSSK